jgi:hypothetical protein
MAVALGCAFSSLEGQEQQEFRWTGSVDRGDAVTIRGISGEIVVTEGSQVVVQAVKVGKESDPATVEIEVVEDAQGVLVCAVYPSKEGKDPNRCARGDDYEMNVDKNDVHVDFQIEIPAAVDLDVRTVNGDVSATGVSGRVKAATVNGSIDLATRGPAEAATVNGSIEASMGSASWNGGLSFKTVNGGITLTVPDGTSADVKMQTLNGAIESDFPFTVQGRMGFTRRQLEGQIGGGGEQLELETVNGTIRLLSSG